MNSAAALWIIDFFSWLFFLYTKLLSVIVEMKANSGDCSTVTYHGGDW